MKFLICELWSALFVYQLSIKRSAFLIPTGKRCTRLSKSDIRVQIVHSDHNATRGNDDEEDVKEPMVNVFIVS